MYFKSLSMHGMKRMRMNTYDRHEDNEAFNESLSSLVREITRNCSAVFLTWSKFPDLENGVKPEPGWYANYVFCIGPLCIRSKDSAEALLSNKAVQALV